MILAGFPQFRLRGAGVRRGVRGGTPPPGAVAPPRFFPPLYVNMVRAGEAGGFLDGVLQRLTEYLERAQLLRDEVRSALTYPVLLTLAMSGSMMFLLVYVLPKFSSMFADLGRALPLSAQLILGLSEAIRSYWWAGALGIAATVGGVRYSIRTPRGRYGWDQWRLRLPVVGLVLRKMEVASLARTLGTLLKSGVPMMQALGIVKETAGNQVISRALGEVEVGVREGAGVAEPLGRCGVFPPLAVQMIAEIGRAH